MKLTIPAVGLVTWFVIASVIRNLHTRVIMRDFGRSMVDASVSIADPLPGRAAVYRRLMYAWYVVGILAAVVSAVWMHYHPDN